MLTRACELGRVENEPAKIVGWHYLVKCVRGRVCVLFFVVKGTHTLQQPAPARAGGFERSVFRSVVLHNTNTCTDALHGSR